MEQPGNRISNHLHLPARQSMRARRRLYPRRREDFIGVNVAKTGDDFDRPIPGSVSPALSERRIGIFYSISRSSPVLEHLRNEILSSCGDKADDARASD